MRLPEFMREIARRCRFRSRETFDLTAAQELRQMAADLEDKALRCEGIDPTTKTDRRLTTADRFDVEFRWAFQWPRLNSFGVIAVSVS